MYYTEWKPIYHQIISEFSFSEQKDMKAAEILNEQLKKHSFFHSLNEVSEILTNNYVFVIGAGSQVLRQIEQYKHQIDQSICISADGATSALKAYNMIPDLIVTDFDGDIEDQLWANDKGSVLVVHGHGDNIQQIIDVIPLIKNMVTGTIQTDPTELSHVENIGGFTDGDRAVFLAAHFNAKHIFLIGFDFHGPIGRFSQPEKKDVIKKQKKLLWAEKLILMINKHHPITFLE